LIQLFRLEDDPKGYELATTPKSCGGGEEFKFLALIGDKIQDLALIKIARESGVIETGRIKKEFIEPFHNDVTLTDLGNFLKINSMLLLKQGINSLNQDDVKECVEALIGCSFHLRGFSEASEILQELFEICTKEGLFYQNPFVQINERYPYLLKQFEIIPVNESGDIPSFICRFEGEIRGKRYLIQSGKFNQKKRAKIDCAEKILAVMNRPSKM
jgi:hypothetical protein